MRMDRRADDDSVMDERTNGGRPQNWLTWVVKKSPGMALGKANRLAYSSASTAERWMSGLSRTPGKRV